MNNLPDSGEEITQLPAHDEFAEQLNTKFKISLSGGNEIELILSELSPVKRTGKYEQYSLYFSGPSDSLLPQALYMMKHNNFGTIGLFLVPVGKDESGYKYEAAFNILSK